MRARTLPVAASVRNSDERRAHPLVPHLRARAPPAVPMTRSSLAEPAAAQPAARRRRCPRRSARTPWAMPNRSRVSSSRVRTLCGRLCRPDERVGRRQVGGLGGQQCAARAISSSSSVAAASRPTIGTVGTPVSAWHPAARRSATAIGPPGPKPARSALFSTTSAGPVARHRAILGLERLGDDHDVDVGGRASAYDDSPTRPARPPPCRGPRRRARERQPERAGKLRR